MEISRKPLDKLNKEINYISSRSERMAERSLTEVIAEWDGRDVPALREASIEALETICEGSTSLAAARAAETYDSVRELQGVHDMFRAVPDARRNPDALAGAVRASLNSVVKTGDTDTFKKTCVARINTECRLAANRCAAYNARIDPKKPKFARVPAGRETCGFCLMLSSFGYTYNTEEAASHAHKGCDCRVVQNYGHMQIEGYDPDAMYERYQSCVSALGGRVAIREEWDRLSSEEKKPILNAMVEPQVRHLSTLALSASHKR
ncbi:hypothetical protein KPC83_02960 [Collinsella sp. zg1085]|uniref:VG15 protein n=1 Tax=Collinsella sp. zg1085 TaxID=2844380 RepID=UPI001C0DB082|nr:hypothetical protein [Collinsella sp. zg1085]QWT18105.1 hypothetical protein KPC83_02960 [Collinsella sp. zg1085]